MVLTDIGLDLLDTWRGLPRRPKKALPFWQDLKAGHIAPVMPHLWVLQYCPPFSMYVRFMGSEVVRLGGHDTTGADFLNTRIPPTERGYMMSIYQRCFESRCGTALTRAISPLGCNIKLLHTTLLPLESESKNRWMLIGCSSIENRGVAGDFDDSGTATYSTRRMQPPYYFDLGFGLPALDHTDSRKSA